MISSFQFLRRNIPSDLLFCVYISQLMCKYCTFSYYTDFISGVCSLHENHSNIILRSKDWNSLSKFTVTIRKLVDRYDLYVSQLTSDMFSLCLIFRFMNSCLICNSIDCLILHRRYQCFYSRSLKSYKPIRNKKKYIQSRASYQGSAWGRRIP